MEKRLIDVDNAISVLKILSDKCYDDNAFKQAISVLESVPTIDAVEVTRCKDCKHRPRVPKYYENGFSLEFPDYICPCQCEDGFYSYVPNDNWFCHNGER